VIYGDDEELYRHRPTGILQRCITEEEDRNLLRDLHSGACGHHAAPRTLVGNMFRQGFYWPTAVSNAIKLVRSCKGCQYFARQIHLLGSCPINHSHHMVVHCLGARLGRTPEENDRGLHPLARRRRQVFQVDRGPLKGLDG
jgi:hypothetical protein